MTVAVAILLACVAGYVDALARLNAGAFVANMTGNTVYLAIAAVRESWQPAAKYGCSLAAFVLGAVAARSMLRRAACRRCALAGTAGALLAATWLHGFAELIVLAAAMGSQDAAVMRFGGTSINTVFVTGDLVDFSDAVADLQSRRRSSIRKALDLGSVWLGYVVGAGVGALAAHWQVPSRFDPRFAAAALVIAAIAAWAGTGRPPPRQ